MVIPCWIEKACVGEKNNTFKKKLKNQRANLKREELSFLCTALTSMRSYNPCMKFQVINILNIFQTKIKQQKPITQILKGKFIIHVHCTHPQWDLSMYEVYINYISSYATYILQTKMFQEWTETFTDI